jgi:hypothetical protein
MDMDSTISPKIKVLNALPLMKLNEGIHIEDSGNSNNRGALVKREKLIETCFSQTISYRWKH